MHSRLFDRAFEKAIRLQRCQHDRVDEHDRPVALVLEFPAPVPCSFYVNQCRGVLLPQGVTGNLVYLERVPDASHTLWGHCPLVYGHPLSRINQATQIVSVALSDRSTHSSAPRLIEALRNYVHS